MEDEGVRTFSTGLRHVIRYTQRGENALAQKALASISDKSQLSHLEPQAKAMVASTLGQIYHAIGDFGAADKEYKFYLDTIESIYGKKHLATSDAFSTYAVFLTQRLQLRQALDYAGQALIIRLDQLGVFHVCTADSHYNLGILFRMLRRYADSLREFQFARSIRSELLGPDALESAEVDFSIACTYQMNGQFDEAFVHYSSALRSRKVHLGAAHPYSRCTEHLVEAMRNTLVGHAYNLQESESALARMSRSLDPTVSAIGHTASRAVRRVLNHRGWFLLRSGENIRGLEDAEHRMVVGRFLEEEREATRAASKKARLETNAETDIGSSDESFLSEQEDELSHTTMEGAFEVSLVSETDPHYSLADLRLVLEDDNAAKSILSQHTRRSLSALLRNRKMSRSTILETFPRERPSVGAFLEAIDRSRRRTAFRLRRQQKKPIKDRGNAFAKLLSKDRSKDTAPVYTQGLVTVPKGYYPILMPEGYFFSRNSDKQDSPVEKLSMTRNEKRGMASCILKL